MNVANAGVPLEVVAAITAALAAVMDRPVGSFVVTKINPEERPGTTAAPSVWSKAGVMESHLARRQFGFRTR